MQKFLLLILSILFSVDSIAQKTGSVYSPGPYEIVVDAKSLRAEAGWSVLNITDVSDTISSRSGAGVHLKNEFRIFSHKVDKYSEFVVWDGLYFGIQIGKVNSETIGEDLPRDDISREGKFMGGFQFGYDFFLGYRNKYWGLLAGVRPQWQSATAGDFSISTTKGGFDLLRYSSPLALRAEWRPFAHFEYRIIASAWKSFFGPSEQSGVRIEFPTLPTRRYWLFVEYALQQTSWDYLSTVQGPYGGFRTWTIGLRVGSLM
jgi:hypothetical protein